MRISCITQWFDPEPTPKGLAFVDALASLGNRVEVLTGFPNYPDGRLYAGYRIKLRDRSQHGKTRVTRVPLVPSHDVSPLHRVINYLSFGLSAVALGPFFTGRADVIYVYHPPITSALAAIVLSWFKRAPLVLDVQDLWPDTLAATGMLGGRPLRMVAGICALAYRWSAQIVAPSPGIAHELVARGVSSRKVTVIYNWCDESRLTFTSDVPAGEADHFQVVFAGTMGIAQSLDSVLDAAELLQTELPTARFVFLGGGVQATQLAQRVTDTELSNVRFMERLPMSEVGRILAAADALLVHLRDDPLFEITVPSKTQAYMAAGRPILMAVRGDAADLIRQADCGITCEPEDPRSLADAVIRLASLSDRDREEMGKRGREFYWSNLSLGEGARRFNQVFRDAVAVRTRP